jgi:type IX secretion system PorP/SprF family membrane protein
MKFKLNLLIIISYLTAINSSAQDFVFSQVYNNRLFQNPSFTGYEEGVLRASLMHRAQYITPGPYSLNTLAIDRRLCKPDKIGIGLFASSEEQGDGFLQTAFIGISLGFHQQLNKKYSLSAGMQLSAIQQSVNWSKYVFPDQINAYGIDPNLISANYGLNTNVGIIGVDLGAGILLKKKTRFGKNFIAGLSIYHLSKPNVGLLNNHQLPIRTNLHFGINYPIYNNELNITCRWIQQDNLNFQSIDINTDLNYKKYFFSGVGLRNNLNRYYYKNILFILLNVGFKKNINNSAFKFGFSYDLPVGSNIGPAGIYELSIIVELGTKCLKSKKLECVNF